MSSIRDAIAKCGAVLEGEFLVALTSRRVAKKYVNMDPVLTRPTLVDAIGSKLVRGYDRRCNAVVGPAISGIPFVYAAARALRIGNTSLDLRTAFAEKQADGSFQFERMGFVSSLVGRDVLVVEDATMTGGSAKAVVDLVRKAGGTVVGVTFIWNHGSVTAETLGVSETQSLVTEHAESWEPHEQPDWGTLPLVQNVGHPEYYPDYPGPTTSLLTT
ncbi:MAG: phosphoribosyltransferase family protein [Candidatus Paceibacterota bacterium]